MSNWKNDQLENITLFIKDGSHGSHKDYENGIPLLSAKDIEGGKVQIPNDCRRISKNDYDQIHKGYQLQENDLALTIVGTIGRVAIIEKIKQTFTFQRSVGLFRIDSLKVIPRYCYHFFTSNQFQQSLERSKNASAQGGVYLGELAKICIAYPEDLVEQKKITQILSTADAVIDKTHAAITKYKAIKQGMLIDFFNRGIDEKSGKLRHKKEDAPELYKQSELGWIPKEWDLVLLKDVIDPIMSNVDKHIKDDELKVLLCNYMDVYSNTYLTQSISYSNGSVNVAEMNRFLLKLHDVIITKDSETPDDIAVPALVYNEFEKLICGYHLCILRSKSQCTLEGEFLMWQLQLPEINNQFSVRANGSTRYGLTIKGIESVFLKIPKNIKEQKEISIKLKTINNKIASEQEYLNKIQQIKSGLMADLLSGNKLVSLMKELKTNNQ